MKYKIGIFGSAIKEKDSVVRKARLLGKALREYKNILIVVTGACSGIPYQVASEAAKGGVEVLGFSPVINLARQREFTSGDDLSIYTKIIYTPSDFEFSSDLDVSKKYRNVISIANCDAGIIAGGRWGTMNEFTNLYDFGKVIGVLIGTGEIADELPILCKKINKKSKVKIFFHQSPEVLLKRIINELKREKRV